jgi:hypothetical protein
MAEIDGTARAQIIRQLECGDRLDSLLTNPFFLDRL